MLFISFFIKYIIKINIINNWQLTIVKINNKYNHIVNTIIKIDIKC